MTSPRGRVRLGVLGCAGIAWRRTLPAVEDEPSLDLVAVASRDADKAHRFGARFGCEPVEGYQRLLDRADIDAVYVPLPAALHSPWARAALRAGKHVLVEKPLTPDPAETAELLTAARKAGRVLMENYMFPFHTQHAAIRQLIAEGAVGEPRSFLSAFTIPRRPEGDIRLQAALGGGALLDVGGYPVGAAELILGPRLRVVGAALRRQPDLGVDIAGAALLVTDDDVTAHLTFGMDHAYRASYELWGTAGRLVLEHAFAPPADHRPVVRIHRQDGVEELVLPADDQYRRAMRAFASAVLNGDSGHGEGDDDGTDLSATRRTEREGAALHHAELVRQIARTAEVQPPSTGP
ncbi:Gfo/Idh/MocA family oxidoreductase [Micromonospora sp. NPDC050200]|uniref:Gfo/Idh/MocA family protein n=1 Tax=Micromonospora sp. NPDC050200 TaxID=3155664 RepID=UPI0033CD4C9F